jgi:hypothetical protein
MCTGEDKTRSRSQRGRTNNTRLPAPKDDGKSWPVIVFLKGVNAVIARADDDLVGLSRDRFRAIPAKEILWNFHTEPFL